MATVEREGQDVALTIRSLLADARAVGLRPNEQLLEAGDEAAALRALVLVRDGSGVESTIVDDSAVPYSRRALEREQESLREALARVTSRRDLLLDEHSGEGEYERSLESQSERLLSLELLPDHDQGNADTCPLCEQKLPHPDPTTTALRGRLAALQE